ncbi:MAG: PAS domain S-box protein, partial [Dechloromonas sp.]|nr:PAS domain S-box protein [Dechloromonas sp.]
FVREGKIVEETRTDPEGGFRVGELKDGHYTLIAAGESGFAVVGLNGSFQRVNQALCDITGYQEHELTELTFQDITHPDDLDTDVSEAARLLHGEISSYQMDKRYYAKDGHLWL